MIYQIYPRSSPTATATASATCPASPRGCPTCATSASTRSGSRRSTPRRRPTPATTSPTTATSTRSSARSPTPTRCSRDAHDARPPGHRRPRAQPHLRRARVVPGGAGRRPGQPRARPLPLPRRPGRGRRAAAEQLGSRSSAARPGPASPSRRHARPVVPAPVRRRAARPQLGAPRGARRVRVDPAVLARPRRRRLPRRRRPRPGQGGRPARLDAEADAARAAPTRRPSPRGSPTTPRARPMWDQDGVHEIYRDWRTILDAYAGDRILSPRRGSSRPSGSPATSAPTSCTRRSTSTSCDAPGRAAACARSSTTSLARQRRRSARPTTWVLSNHDVVRHATRLGLTGRQPRPNGIGADDPQPDAELGLRRARAATAADARAARRRLPLPGRGARPARATPTCPTSSARTRPFRRTDGEETAATAAGCRCRGSEDAPSLGFGPARQTWLPQPDVYGDVRRRPAGRRRGLDARAVPAAAAPCAASARLGTGGARLVDGLRRRRRRPAQQRSGDGERTTLVVANLGAEPVALPDGPSVLVASGPLDRRGPVPDRHHGVGRALTPVA